MTIPEHSQIILIIGSHGSGKTNTLLNLINEQDDIDKSYLHAEDLSEPKYKFLTKKYKSAGIIHLTHSLRKGFQKQDLQSKHVFQSQ